MINLLLLLNLGINATMVLDSESGSHLPQAIRINIDTIVDPISTMPCNVGFNEQTIYFSRTDEFNFSNGKAVIEIEIFNKKIEQWKILYLALYRDSILLYSDG